jgi:hypothetical protein
MMPLHHTIMPSTMLPIATHGSALQHARLVGSIVSSGVTMGCLKGLLVTTNDRPMRAISTEGEV